MQRKYNLVTDLGKFLDPLADKMLVIGVLIAITVRYAEFNLQFCRILGWALFVIILREMSVTLLRMIAANKEGIVISAGLVGKSKNNGSDDCNCHNSSGTFTSGYKYGYVIYNGNSNACIDTLVGNNYFKAYILFLNRK